MDATLTALRASRIQQHLIGTFGFSDARRSFDGGNYAWSSSGWDFTAVGAIPTRGGFQTDGWGWVKTPFAYAALTLRGSARCRWPRTESAAKDRSYWAAALCQASLR